MGCLERWATRSGLLRERDGPQEVGYLEKGATRGGLLREGGHKRWAT